MVVDMGIVPDMGTHSNRTGGTSDRRSGHVYI